MKGKKPKVNTTSKVTMKVDLLRKYGFEESSNAWQHELEGRWSVFRKAEVENFTLDQLKGELNEITKGTISSRELGAEGDNK